MYKSSRKKSYSVLGHNQTYVATKLINVKYSIMNDDHGCQMSHYYHPLLICSSWANKNKKSDFTLYANILKCYSLSFVCSQRYKEHNAYADFRIFECHVLLTFLHMLVVVLILSVVCPSSQITGNSMHTQYWSG